MTRANQPKVQPALTPRLNKYIPWVPSVPQTAFLLTNQMEVLYGGAAAGGKSVALLMAALQYVDLPNYHALLLRRTYTDLKLPGALIPLSHEWLDNTDARYNDEDKTWYFPSGSTLTFGYLETDRDLARYQGSAYHFIGYDELTQFPIENHYTYLFSRLRGKADLPYPFRMRGATNPGGAGGKWVYDRFFGPNKPADRIFIPAKVTDNPYVNQDMYMKALGELNDIDKARLLDGRWDIMALGEYFHEHSFITIPNKPNIRYIRYWDLSAQTDTTKDSDFTAGALIGIMNVGNMRIVTLADLAVTRGSPGYIEGFVQDIASKDGPGVTVVIEQEAGSGGANTVFNYKTRVLKGYNVIGNRPQGTKFDRVGVLSGYAATGHFYIVAGPWNEEFKQEALLFPTKGIHDDRIDAVASGAAYLLRSPEPKIRSIYGYANNLELDLSQTAKSRDRWAKW